MNIDKEHEDKLNALKNRSTYANSYINLVRELIESIQPFSWKLLEYLLTIAETKDRAHFLELKMEIQRSYHKIRSFNMLIYMYFLKETKKQFAFSYANWKSDYVRFVDNMNAFSSMLAYNSNSLICQQTLWLVIRVFPKLIVGQYIMFGEAQLVNIIQWVTYFKTPDSEVEKYNDVCQLVKMAKQIKFTTLNVDNKMQHVMFKKLIEIVCQVKNGSSNVFLFVYPILLSNQEVNYFCQIYSDFITDLGQEALLNFFIAITKSSLTKQILFFISGVSVMLKNQQQFFKLRFLYQNFILPILVRRSKLCKKVQDSVFEISYLYILGFLKHCDIGINGVSCITKSIGRIKNEAIKQKWIQLCNIICQYYPDLMQQMKELLKTQLNQDIEFKLQNNMLGLENNQQIWDITIRNGRKRKKYVKVYSNMRGITNRNNQCYIISTIQGIQKIQLFQRLLDRYRQEIKLKFGLLNQLRTLFNQISGHRKAEKIIVGHLKKISSQQFAVSENQEDARQYLQKLFDLIEQQMKNIPPMLQQFKSIFQINETNTIQCKKCHKKNDRDSNTYIHTLPHTQVLSEVSDEQIVLDYMCDNCKSTGSCVTTTKISPSKVLIVFITRLVNKQGKIVKQLSTQRILRKFMSYELVGMVSHKGRSVYHGHYVYFHRINPKRWAEFNDNQVHQFDLQQPYEQFQSEWKAQMTPYMLFYRQLDEGK